MTRPAIRVVDLTTRLGDAALAQCTSTSPDSTGLRLVRPGTMPHGPALEWVKPPGHLDGLSPGDRPDGLFLLVGPGSVRAATQALRRAIDAGVRWIRALLAPNALVEETALQSMLSRDDGATRLHHLHRLHRLPDSSPETLWFVLIDESNRLSGPLGLTSFPPPDLKKEPMSNLQQSMTTAMTIDGALAAALVDFRSGMCLAQAGTGLNLDLAAAGNTQVVRAKLQTMESLGLRKGGIEDILITLSDQYHLIRLVPNNAGLFLYLVLDRSKGNLALARYKLTEIERGLKV
jgi:hypothetical protein